MPLTSSPPIEIVLPPGPVLETLAQSGVFLQTACGGVGRCGQCRVIVNSQALTPPDAAERKLLGAADREAGVRLACRLRVDSGCRLRIPRASLLEDSDIQTVRLRADLAADAVYGLAVDLGTSRLSALLLDLVDGRAVAGATSINPQVYYGLDVLNRLKVAALRWVENGFALSLPGGGPPRGLCGSALVQALAESRRAGLIDQRGRIIASSAIVTQTTEGTAIPLWPGDPDAALPALMLTQADIDALLLAKGAIRTGIEVLLDQTGTPIREIKQVVLAGAFGTGLDPAAAAAVGLFPDQLPQPFATIEDAAARGAGHILWQIHRGRPTRDVTATSKHINLVTLPNFKKRFARSIYFP